MLKIIFKIVFVAALAIAGISAFRFFTGSGKSDLIKVETPRLNAAVSSPLIIKGEAKGFWFFEASFPIFLYDDNGRQLGVAVAQAQGDWMTEEFVPFEARLEFQDSSTATGVLVLKKDNPSGLPEHDDELRIPVRF